MPDMPIAEELLCVLLAQAERLHARTTALAAVHDTMQPAHVSLWLRPVRD